MSHLKCKEKIRQACNNERPVVIIGIHQLQFYVYQEEDVGYKKSTSLVILSENINDQVLWL